jgi:hypothetical protein
MCGRHCCSPWSPQPQQDKEPGATAGTQTHISWVYIFFKGTRAAVRLCTVAWPVAPTVQTYVQARAGMDT